MKPVSPYNQCAVIKNVGKQQNQIKLANLFPSGRTARLPHAQVRAQVAAPQLMVSLVSSCSPSGGYV